MIVFGALEARVSNQPSPRERSIANIRTIQGLPDSFLRAFEMQPQKTLQNLQCKRQSVRALGGKDAMRSDPYKKLGRDCPKEMKKWRLRHAQNTEWCACLNSVKSGSRFNAVGLMGKSQAG